MAAGVITEVRAGAGTIVVNPIGVTEGTMLWGSRQGTARREVSFSKESV